MRRKHHFVPVAYLNQFVNSRGFLNEASIENRLIRWVHPNNTCYINDYYDLPPELLQRYQQNNKSVLELEAFALFENYIGAFNKFFLARQPVFSIHHHVVLAKGYIYQKQRTPYYLRQMENQTPAEKLQIALNAARKLREDFTKQFGSDPRVAKFLTDEFWNGVINKAVNEKQDHHRTQLMGLLTSAMGISEGVESAMSRFFDMQIAVLCAPDDEYFITSDNPGFTLCTMKPGELFPYNTHFATMDSITYPINSKQALYIYWDKNNLIRGDKPVHYETLSRADMLQVNQTITNFASAKIYCASRHYLKAFVDSYPLKDWGQKNKN